MGFFGKMAQKFIKRIGSREPGEDDFPIITVDTEADAVALDVLYVGLVSVDGVIDDDENSAIALLAAEAFDKTDPDAMDMAEHSAHLASLAEKIADQSDALFEKAYEAGDYDVVFKEAAGRFRGTPMAEPIHTMLCFLAAQSDDVDQEERGYLEMVGESLGLSASDQKLALARGQHFAKDEL